MTIDDFLWHSQPDEQIQPLLNFLKATDICLDWNTIKSNKFTKTVTTTKILLRICLSQIVIYK